MSERRFNLEPSFSRENFGPELPTGSKEQNNNMSAKEEYWEGDGVLHPSGAGRKVDTHTHTHTNSRRLQKTICG